MSKETQLMHEYFSQHTEAFDVFCAKNEPEHFPLPTIDPLKEYFYFDCNYEHWTHYMQTKDVIHVFTEDGVKYAIERNEHDH